MPDSKATSSSWVGWPPSSLRISSNHKHLSLSSLYFDQTKNNKRLMDYNNNNHYTTIVNNRWMKFLELGTHRKHMLVIAKRFHWYWETFNKNEEKKMMSCEAGFAVKHLWGGSSFPFLLFSNFWGGSFRLSVNLYI